MISISNENKKDCCGCTACANICPKQCITMTDDNEGFKYPLVDFNKCVDCHLCERVCPIINKIESKEEPKEAYIVRNNDAEIVRNSTSGGAVTAFSTLR